MYDVVIEKTPDGEARVLFAVLRGEDISDDILAFWHSVEASQEDRYTTATAEAIALGNLNTTGE